jgi:hypothetical protein
VTVWFWLVLMIIVGWATGRYYQANFANGILTRWPARLIKLPRPLNRRLMRLFQTLFIYAWFLAHLSNSNQYFIVTFIAPLIVLDLDDVLTSDHDDRWKRRWQAVRNKIKWKMDIPVPARETTR